MKKTLITLLLSCCFFGNFAQDQELSYDVHGKYKRPVTAGKLYEAKSLSDFIEGYPKNWITEYISVEISTTCEGKTLQALASNETISIEQQNILNKAELGTNIAINVKYKATNTITAQPEIHNMVVSMTVVPETEAEYLGGLKELNKYLKENIVLETTKAMLEQVQEAKVMFTVGERGEIINAQMSKTSGDLAADKLILDVVNKMPKWKPAKNAKGINVKQDFQFSISKGGC